MCVDEERNRILELLIQFFFFFWIYASVSKVLHRIELIILLVLSDLFLVLFCSDRLRKAHWHSCDLEVQILMALFLFLIKNACFQ